MKTKNELIHDLPRVKLVLGNGFDLHCHLKTSYADYFRHFSGKNAYFLEWIDKYLDKYWKEKPARITFQIDWWVEFTNFEKTNVWDFYFFLVSREKEKEIGKWRWCDIEKMIERSLDDPSPKNLFCWPLVYQTLINGEHYRYKSSDLRILAAVAYQKNEKRPFESPEAFYTFLLEQLKEFERNFGAYIYHQHVDDTNRAFGILRTNEPFRVYAFKTLEQLCNIENLVRIDSFNFDSLDRTEVEAIFHNVNGDIRAPIFGIDSNAFPSKDPRHIFAKTSRRMELDMVSDTTAERTPFSNVIVFGHSLNAADYSYFFSLLDRLDISNLESNSKIVFAFVIYDPEKEYEIRSNIRESVIKLFEDYSVYKGNQSPNRLLDALTTQGKVLMYEIPRIIATEAI